MAGDLAGKVALVTGSTSGIGLGIAAVLAERGATVMLNGLGTPDDVAAALAALRDAGAGADHDPADMADPAQVAAMVARTGERFGGPDILVLNAGIQHVAPIEAFPAERWDAVIAVNLSAAFHAMRAAIPGMRSRGFGRIVAIASAHGKVASAGKSAYVAAKHGLLGLVKVAAIETAGSGVTANAICPGWVRTPLVERQLRERAAREGRDVAEIADAFLAEKQPLRAFTTPRQIGATAAFLCGEDAATVTGAAWSVDGGWTAA